MAEKKEAREILRKKLRTKLVYHYVDEENDIDVKSREVSTKGTKVIHYPFNPKNGNPRYSSIKKITYEGLPEPLPPGFLKKARTGYGFTRDLSPLLYALSDALPRVRHIVVTESRKTQVKSPIEVILNIKDLDSARPEIHTLNSKQKGERSVLTNNLLAHMLPQKFKPKHAEYQKGQLSTFLTRYDVKPGHLSDTDIRGMSRLLTALPIDHSYVKMKGILASKESFDRIYIEDIIQRFDDLLLRKTETKRLEDKWQEFLSDNILYFNFGYVERFEKEKIQGDKTLNIPDFILLNTFGYLDVFEIKTHLTQLLRFDEGRKNFYWASEASRAIAQTENYIDSIIKQEDTILKNIRDEYAIHNVDAVRPVVYIIASSKPHIAGAKTSSYKGKMAKKMRNDFRRLNNSLKNITFVLYDELLEVFRNTLSRLKASATDDEP